MKPKMNFFVLLVFPFLFSLLALKYLPIPYVWIFLAWSLVFLLLTFLSHRSPVKILSFNLIAMLVILAIVEAYLGYQESKPTPFVQENLYVTQSDPVLGYAAIPNTQRRARKWYRDEPVYDVTITIDENGLRSSPPFTPNDDKEEKSILFFGCSVTFGEGVNDEQTMPYVTGLLTKGTFKIYNFALHGYGPQQMLAAIEHGHVDSIVKVSPRYIIYQAIPDHVHRLLGLRKWLLGGPQYILSETGEVVHSGTFSKCNPQHGNCLWKNVTNQARKSFLVRRVLKIQYSPNDIELFLKVVELSRTLLRKQYPQAEFHVIFWNKEDNPISNEILKGFKERIFPVHLVHDIIPDRQSNKKGYIISPHDGHPNARAHEYIAQYVVKEIITQHSHTEFTQHSDLTSANIP